MALPRRVRILAMDGGGVRGMLPLAMLRHLERVSGQRVTDLFDVIAGSSAGGVLSLLLTRPGVSPVRTVPRYTLDQASEVFSQDIHHIFSRPWRQRVRSAWGLAGHVFAADPVTATMHRYFGDDELKDAVREVLLTTYDLSAHRPRYLTRRAARADPAMNFRLRDAARATFAAPVWFPSVRLRSVTEGVHAVGHHLVDGGIYANNPAPCALGEVLRTEGHGVEAVVVSLGTGRGPTEPYDAVGHGLAAWLPRLLGLFFEGQGGLVEDLMDALLRGPDGTSRYHRFQPLLPPERTRVDNVHPENVRALRAIADAYMAGCGARLALACAQLTTPAAG